MCGVPFPIYDFSVRCPPQCPPLPNILFYCAVSPLDTKDLKKMKDIKDIRNIRYIKYIKDIENIKDIRNMNIYDL